MNLAIKDIQSGSIKVLPLATPVCAIGKSQENHIILDQIPVSRRHCEIRAKDGGWRLIDLDSRNGTLLDGVKVTGEAPLLPGQNIQVAGYIITMAEEARETAPPPAASATPSQPPRRCTPPELKRSIHTRLLDEMDLKHTDVSEKSQHELRQHASTVCSKIIRNMMADIPSWLAPEALVKEIVDEAVGLGPLEELLDDETVDEIMVVGWDRVYVERRGKIQLSPKQFTDNNQVVAVIRRILAPIGRRIDETTPMQDGRLADGSRVNAIIPPLALSGPTITIRKFAKKRFEVTDLISKFHSMTDTMGKFLKLAVEHRKNILISGGTGSGKTTLLNVMSGFIPDNERIVTVEDAAELQLPQDHVVRLESRPANLEGKNAVNIRDLVRNSLRMRPDRIVVGECRGGEALDMLQAMNTGHDGSLTTLHANSPRDALARLETLVLMAGMELPARAIREQIASAIDLIVQISRMPDGSRKVLNITAIEGMEGDVVSLQDVYRFEQKGFDANGKVLGAHIATGMIPEFVQDMRKRGIPVDISIFNATHND